MPLAMEKDEALDPVAIGVFGTQAQMAKARDIANLVEQLPSRHGE
jgi:hypothetical protein